MKLELPDVCEVYGVYDNEANMTQQAQKEACQLGLTYWKLITPVATRWNFEAVRMESCLNLWDVATSLAGKEDSFGGARLPPCLNGL